MDRFFSLREGREVFDVDKFNEFESPSYLLTESDDNWLNMVDNFKFDEDQVLNPVQKIPTKNNPAAFINQERQAHNIDQLSKPQLILNDPEFNAEKPRLDPQEETLINNARIQEAKVWNHEQYSQMLNDAVGKKEERLKTGESPLYARGNFRNVSVEVFDAVKTFTKAGPDTENFYGQNHFADLIQENGSRFEELNTTWEKGMGVFKANHSQKIITNPSLLEWKKNHYHSETGKSDIKQFQEQVKTDIQRLSEQKDRMHKYAFDDIKNLSGSERSTFPGVLSSKFPLLDDFLNEKYIKKMNPDESFLPSLDEISVDLRKILFILEIGKIGTTEISKTQKRFLNRYKLVLLYAQDIQQLKEESSILGGVIDNSVDPHWETRIISLEQDIKNRKKEILELKSHDPENTAAITDLHFEIGNMRRRLDFYKSYKGENSDINPNQTLYSSVFEVKKDEDGKEKITVKNTTNAIDQLSEYYDWVRGELFIPGIPRPINKDVEASIIASSYRGDFSPSEFGIALKKMVDIIKHERPSTTMQGFYDEIGKIMNGGASDIFSDPIVARAFEGKIFTDFQKASNTFSDPNLRGNRHPGKDQGALEKNYISRTSQFKEEWGFSIGTAYATWKSLAPTPIGGNQKETGVHHDLQKNEMLNSNALPLSNWFDENGNVNSSAAMKSFLARIIPSSDKSDKPVYKKILSKNWNEKDKDVKAFVQTLQSHFEEHEKVATMTNFVNTSQESQNFIDSIKGSLGDTLYEKGEFVFEELMDGNPKYWAFGAALLWFGKGKKWFWDGLKIGTFGALANTVVKDLSGYDVMDEALFLLKGNTKRQASNPASWALKEMEEGKQLEKTEFSFNELERAGTSIGQANLKDTLLWYNECKHLQGKDNPDDVGKIYNNSLLPSGLKNNLGFIFDGSAAVDQENGEKPARAAFEYFDRYLKSISIKHKPSIGASSSGVGFQHLSDNYIDVPEWHPNRKNVNETYFEGGIEKRGYRLEEVFAQEADPALIKRMAMMNSPLANYVAEWSNDAMRFITTHLESEFGTAENAMKKMKEIKDEAISLGMTGWNMVGDELKFLDKTKQGWKIVKDKTIGAWNIIYLGTDKKTLYDKKGEAILDKEGKLKHGGGIEAGVHHTTKTFEEAWNWTKRQASTANEAVTALSNGVNVSTIDETVPSTLTLPALPDNEITKVLYLLDDMGLTDDVGKTFGIVDLIYNSDTHYAPYRNVSQNIKTSDILILANRKKVIEAVTAIKDERIKLKGKGNTPDDITKGDVLTYFFAPFGNMGSVVQGGIDAVQKFANFSSSITQSIGFGNLTWENWIRSITPETHISLDGVIDGDGEAIRDTIGSVKRINVTQRNKEQGFWTQDDFKAFVKEFVENNVRIAGVWKDTSGVQNDIDADVSNNFSTAMMLDLEKYFLSSPARMEQFLQKVYALEIGNVNAAGPVISTGKFIGPSTEAVYEQLQTQAKQFINTQERRDILKKSSGKNNAEPIITFR